MSHWNSESPAGGFGLSVNATGAQSKQLTEQLTGATRNE